MMAVHLATRLGESPLVCMICLRPARLRGRARTRAARFVYVLLGGFLLSFGGSVFPVARASARAPFLLVPLGARSRSHSFPLRPELVCSVRRAFSASAFGVVCSHKLFARAIQAARWPETSGHNSATLVSCATIFFVATDRSVPVRVEREPRRLFNRSVLWNGHISVRTDFVCCAKEWPPCLGKVPVLSRPWGRERCRVCSAFGAEWTRHPCPGRAVRSKQKTPALQPGAGPLPERTYWMMRG